MVDPASAVTRTAPAVSVQAPVTEAGPPHPAWFFRNGQAEARVLKLPDGKDFAFGRACSWGTDDPVLGEQIATVAAQHGIEVVSTPK